MPCPRPVVAHSGRSSRAATLPASSKAHSSRGSSMPSGARAACSWAVWTSCMATVSNNGRNRRCSWTGGVQVEGVVAGQEVLLGQVVAGGEALDAFVGVDREQVLGRAVDRVAGLVGAALAGFPGGNGP